MIEHNSINVLACAGLAALTCACSSQPDHQSVQLMNLQPGAIGRIDTQSTRSLPYTLREDDRSTTHDTRFVAGFGGGAITVPLEAFYGPPAAGQSGTWAVDGRGRVVKLPGSSTPGFINRLESMPDGPIQIGQTWEHVTPSDFEAMTSPDIVVQLKRRWRVVEAFGTPTGTAVRVEIKGWSRVIQNAAMTQLVNDIGMFNPQPDWAAALHATADVEIASGTLLGMRLYEDLLGDRPEPDQLVGNAASLTYCLDTTSGYTPRADICGWNL